MEDYNLDYDTISLFTLSDLYMVPMAFAILYLLARIYFRYDGALHLKRYYYWAFFLKIICVLIYAALVQFYWQISDTKRYFIDLLQIQKAANASPEFWSIIFFDAKAFTLDYSMYLIGYIPGPTNVHLYRLALPLSFLCFNNFLAIGMCFSFFSFLGTWKLFKVFIQLYPNLTKAAAFSVLFYPSVLFWSGIGLMKDPITFGALGFLLYGIHRLLNSQQKIKYAAMILISAYLIYVLKVYILVSFAAGAFLWLVLTMIGKIKNSPLRRLVVLLTFLTMIATTFLFFQSEATATAEDGSAAFAADQVISAAAELKELYTRVEAGSNFDVDIDYSTLGLIQFFPQALVICLFRPFLWEAQNPIMLFSAAEGIFLLAFLLFLLFKRGLLFKIGTVVRNDKFIVLLLVFPLLFFFTVAISTFNFGTMARYKIPALPFFVFLLFVLNYKLQLISRQTIVRRSPALPRRLKLS